KWSRIMRMAGIENSTLLEDLNDLHMRHYDWTQARSHKNTSGGDMVMKNPALTVVGTTTRTLFHETLKEKALSGGAVNRYLILPGGATFQPYDGTSYKADGRINGLLEDLTSHAWGHGEEIRTVYSDEAWEAFRQFQANFIIPLMNNPETSEAVK